jgi:hypothetical protein
MTYQDPDPLRDHELDRDVRVERDYGSNAMWGWIAGAVVVVLALVFIFGGSENTSTAYNPSAPVINTPPANDVATAPRGSINPPAPSETTGQNPAPAERQNPPPAPPQ